jgi:hypothetical protein
MAEVRLCLPDSVGQVSGKPRSLTEIRAVGTIHLADWTSFRKGMISLLKRRSRYVVQGRQRTVAVAQAHRDDRVGDPELSIGRIGRQTADETPPHSPARASTGQRALPLWPAPV